MLYKAFKETAKKNLNEMAIVGAEPLMYERVLSLVDKWASIFESGARAAALIVLPRCGEIPILQLALNKADCVFACADVAWPKARLKDVMEQLRPLWILSFNDFSEFGYEKKMIIDEINIWVRINDSSLFEAEVSHVFFSSGSTGIPKSIYLHDQGLVKVVKEQAKVLKIKKGSRVAWCLSPSFDASLSDIYSTLLSGACLCVYESDLTKIKTLLKFLNEGRVSHADLPPSLLSLIKPEDLPELKVVLFGGELANELAIKEWAEIKEIWNAYGPTEASICCAMRRVSDDWVCNEVRPLLPGFIGIIGEGGDLWLAGEMLCIKYHQEELNESKFIFLDGVRYYKTGDLFQKIDGSWFYLGRKDRQFKWNGVLISPEEVESAARKAGCVQANCYHGDKITLDYVGDLSPDILREKIRDFLPSNMIPHEIRREQLKLKSNGKSDL